MEEVKATACQAQHSFEDIMKCYGLLSLIIPWEKLRNQFEVAVAGSSTLFAFMHLFGHFSSMLQGKDPWFMNQEPVSDFDVFVAGRHGSTSSNFRNFVKKVLAKIKRTHEVLEVKMKKNKYCFDESTYEVDIVNVYIREFALPISFVQSPRCSTVYEVVQKFDIDVVQVLLPFHHFSFYMTPATYKSISTDVANVKDFVFEDVPTETERGTLARTLQRMQKYKARGFVFQNMPRLSFFRQKPAAAPVTTEDVAKHWLEFDGNAPTFLTTECKK